MRFFQRRELAGFGAEGLIRDRCSRYQQRERQAKRRGKSPVCIHSG
jgi:hypothetical protein